MSTISHTPSVADHDESHHGTKMYFTIYFVLLGLMALTVLAALFDLGVANFAVAMIIAATKMVLIILYFMHVRYSDKLTWVFSCAAFFWLLIFIVGTLNDYFSRGYLEVMGK